MSPVMFQDLKFQIDDFFMIKWPQQRGLGEKSGLLDASAFQNESGSEKLKSRSGSILGHPTHTTGKKTNLATSRENLYFVICEQQICGSGCASTQSDQHFCCSLPT